MSSNTKYVTIERRGYDITLAKDVYDDLYKKGICISLIIKDEKPCTVQLNTTINGKTKYVGTLKKRLNVAMFRNGDLCDFRKSNLKYNKNRKGI